jgi:hypothetical protein
LPYVIGRPPKRVLALLATTVGMLVTASPALASSHHSHRAGAHSEKRTDSAPGYSSAGCPAISGSPLLSSFGDFTDYVPVPGGTFEGDTTGWSFNNAAVVSGNEPWNVVSPTDSNSLNINAGGSAVSPTFCVDNTMPTFRFFANSANDGRRSGLKVAVRWTLPDGTSGHIPVTTLSADAYSSWQLTRVLPLGSVLSPGQTVNVQLVFTAGSGSAWQIDDVLLDPYAK